MSGLPKQRSTGGPRVTFQPPGPTSPIQGRSKSPIRRPASSTHVAGGETRHVSAKQLERLRQLFMKFDTDKSGTIDKQELRYALKKLGVELNDEELNDMFASVDKNHDGVIDFEEYMKLMTGKLEETHEEEEIPAIYKLFTDKRTGLISRRTLARGARDLKVQLTDQEIDAMFMDADKNGDSYIDRAEFDSIAMRVGFA